MDVTSDVYDDSVPGSVGFLAMCRATRAAEHMGSQDAAPGAGGRSGGAVGKLVWAGRAINDQLSRTVGQMVGDQDRAWARAVLADVERPQVPIGEAWRVSIATIIGRYPRVPGVATRLLGRMDRFGEVAIASEEVGFDGKTVAWDKVLEVRTHGIAEILPDVAVEKEVERIRELLPPIPGRKWVVRKAVEGLLTLLLATVETPEDAAGDDPMIACEIVYRNAIGRPKPLVAGLFGTAILGAIPEAGASLIATAQNRGVPVNAVVSEAVLSRTERAQRLRAASIRIAARLETLRRTHASGALAAHERPAALSNDRGLSHGDVGDSGVLP